MTRIDFYFSLNSPWSFMGSERLANIAASNGAKVNPIPVNPGSVFERTGGLPLPKRSPERQAYRMMELKRWKAFHDIPLVFEPEHFPYDETGGVQLVLAAKKSGENAHALATELMRALWEFDQNPADEAVQDEAVARAGLDAAALRETLSLDDARDEWTALTNKSVTDGVFGVPSYVIDGEIFWGQDRLDFVERKLAG